MGAFILILSCSFACGFAIADAVIRSLPEAHRVFIYACQIGLASVCGLVVFFVTFGILYIVYVSVKNLITDAIEEAKKKQRGE